VTHFTAVKWEKYHLFPTITFHCFISLGDSLQYIYTQTAHISVYLYIQIQCHQHHSAQTKNGELCIVHEVMIMAWQSTEPDGTICIPSESAQPGLGRGAAGDSTKSQIQEA
jgi:hypothetical protein